MARRICVREERKKNSVPKKINNWPIAGVTKPNAGVSRLSAG